MATILVARAPALPTILQVLIAATIPAQYLRLVLRRTIAPTTVTLKVLKNIAQFHVQPS